MRFQAVKRPEVLSPDAICLHVMPHWTATLDWSCTQHDSLELQASKQLVAPVHALLHGRGHSAITANDLGVWVPADVLAVGCRQQDVQTGLVEAWRIGIDFILI